MGNLGYYMMRNIVIHTGHLVLVVVVKSFSVQWSGNVVQVG